VHHKQTVLVIEDEPKIAEVIVSYLENAGFRAISKQDGRAGLESFAKDRPDLILLDLMLPDMPGEQICQMIRMTSKVPIIMLTAKTDEDSIVKGLGMGADDYIVKPFSPRQLIARVETVIRRGGADIGYSGIVVNADRHEVFIDGKLVNLTPIEYKLLSSLMKFRSKTFTREELLHLIFGADYDGYDRTIDTHIKNLRQKIETDPRDPKYVITVHGVGYKYGG
jgi:DNA-binding response OmpR family regulator